MCIRDRFGPILEEFKQNKENLYNTCIGIYKKALEDKGHVQPLEIPELKITAQGGLGTAEEQNLLLDYYKLDSVGWATPFMLVPEVISIDNETLDILAKAKENDLVYSGLSPLGVPFNTVKGVSMSLFKLQLAKKGKPGAACTKGFLKYNTEYTEKPICTSSKEYQSKKISEIKALNLSEADYQKEYGKIIEKECLCKGLSTSTLLSKNISVAPDFKVTCCPGPNLAYFSKVSTLKEMVDHIYGRINLLDKRHRPHMFLKELNMYLDIFRERFEALLKDAENLKEKKQLQKFQKNIFEGVSYYKNLFADKKKEVVEDLEKLLHKYSEIHIEL
jgi:hypothetical protein